MKIGYVTGSLPPTKDGVSEWSLHMLERFFSSEAFQCTLYTQEQHSKHAPIAVNTKVVQDFSFKSVRRIVHDIAASGIELLHLECNCIGYGRSLAVYMIPILLKLAHRGIRVYLTLHEYESFTWKGRLRLLAAVMLADKIFFTDRMNQFKIGKWKNKKKLYPLFVPSQMPEAIAGPETCDNRRKDDEFQVGYWGFIRPDKGLELVLRAFRRLLDEKVPAKLKILAELLPEDPYHVDIRKLIDELAIGEEVVITGYLPPLQLSQHLSSVSVCVLPYANGLTDKRGTFSAAVSLGVPVITTASDFIPEGIQNDKNAVLIPYDEEACYQAIHRLYSDPEIRRAIGQHGKEWSEKRTWDHLLNKLCTYY